MIARRGLRASASAAFARRDFARAPLIVSGQCSGVSIAGWRRALLLEQEDPLRRLPLFLLAVFLGGCGDDEPEAACDVPGHACTFVGVPGVTGYNGEGRHRLDTELYWTMDLSFAADGTVWFIDWNNHLVRRILRDGKVASVVGWNDPVFPGDGTPGDAELGPAGAPGLEVQLNHPTDLVQTDDGKVLVMAWHNHKLREVDPVTGTVRILAGGGPGFFGDGMDASRATFKQPKALERDGEGNLYVLDQQNFRVRKITRATGIITTIAGVGQQGDSGDGGPALAARLNFEAGSNPEPSGGLALARGKLFIADTLSHRVRAVDLATGVIDTVAGSGAAGLDGDGGQARLAKLNAPRDLEIGPDGQLYIADTDNSVIRAMDLDTGIIRTVVGTGQLGLTDDEGALATEVTLRRPFGIEFDPAGDLYVCDTINSRILKVKQ